jgi:hypothetical protein
MHPPLPDTGFTSCTPILHESLSPCARAHATALGGEQEPGRRKRGGNEVEAGRWRRVASPVLRARYGKTILLNRKSLAHRGGEARERPGFYRGGCIDCFGPCVVRASIGLLACLVLGTYMYSTDDVRSLLSGAAYGTGQMIHTVDVGKELSTSTCFNRTSNLCVTDIKCSRSRVVFCRLG